jgi:serine protease Do
MQIEYAKPVPWVWAKLKGRFQHGTKLLECRMKTNRIYQFFALLMAWTGAHGFAQDLGPDDWTKIQELERSRIVAIQKAVPSVVAIYGEDRQGGGSGVLIDPSGIALTNHHVIMGAGVSGWGGISDGNLYRWDLIGTDPGGDVAVILMRGRDDFPYTKLADSDRIRVGDWAMAMGNPFLLTEDQTPTATMGIVSGIKRYQPGAGDNQLIYGNCIQVDSSINPGNSGGPLFDLRADIMGINGRGSFQDRGRVNVGLGYAISANQIKNFLPDLLATKLVEHGSLDANFSNRDGKVVCSTINELSKIAQAGLALGDRLLEFEGVKIESANQFTNLICTLPEDWPASLVIEKEDGTQLSLCVRLLGLPYAKPPMPPAPEKDKEPSPEEKQALERQKQMFELLRAEPGTIRNMEVNRKFADWLISQIERPDPAKEQGLRIVDEIRRGDERIGSCRTEFAGNGSFEVVWELEGKSQRFSFDGEKFFEVTDGQKNELTLTQAKLAAPIVQAMGTAFMNRRTGFESFGKLQLDGSDKANLLVSSRMKLMDEEEDWFYFWVSLADPIQNIEASLVKASAEQDCDNRRGGIVFEDWRVESGWKVAYRRHLVMELKESKLFTLNTQSVELLPGERQ